MDQKQNLKTKKNSVDTETEAFLDSETEEHFPYSDWQDQQMFLQHVSSLEENQEELLPEIDEATKVAQNIFHVPGLYPWQRLVVANIMECAAALKDKAENQDDTFNKGQQVVLLPTGAGKSLCFMVPAVLLEGITLIIYPLLGLMSDQLRRIQEAGLNAVLFRGGQDQEEREVAFKALDSGTKIILANPEVLQSEKLLKKLSSYPIVHLAIDEAHCVAQWGDTFRPSYLQLQKVIETLHVPIVTAFTATASPPVLQRITEVLFQGVPPYLMQSSSDRQNISYSVVYTNAKEKTALLLATKEQRPLIVFCGTRAKAKTTAQFFREFFPPEDVRFYHAGLSREEKTAVEQWFFPHKSGILCCTCAFGMGIDKSDIRTVIHLEPPSTPEAYIQEAGRGGRDTKPAKAILLWGNQDEQKAASYPDTAREKIMALFTQGTICRRKVLLEALGDTETVCSGCDVCDARDAGKTIDTIPRENMFVMNYLKKYNGRWTVQELVEKVKNSANKMTLRNLYDYGDFTDTICQLEKKNQITFRGLRTKRVALPSAILTSLWKYLSFLQRPRR